MDTPFCHFEHPNIVLTNTTTYLLNIIFLIHPQHPHCHLGTIEIILNTNIKKPHDSIIQSNKHHSHYIIKGKHHGFNYINMAHDHNQDHIMGERDNHIATSTSPQPRGGTTPASSWEAATSMKKAPEPPTPSGRVPKQSLQTPETRV